MSNYLYIPDNRGTSDNDANSSARGLTRRKFLIGTGGVLGAAALFGASHLTPGELLGLQIARAQSVNLNSDMDILMFALTLEHLEDAAYRTVNSSGLLSGAVADYFRAFGEHEHAHVVALTETITKLGGQPVAEQASYNFPKFNNQNEVLQFFAMVEEVGAGAYLGAAPLIKDKQLLGAAASIHDVEGQHASVLRAVLGEAEPSPAFAAPKAVKDVLNAVTPLLSTTGSTTGGGQMAGMPRTGAGNGFDLNPWLVTGALGAAALGALLRVRTRNTHQETDQEA